MNKKNNAHTWKTQTMADNCETVNCPAYDDYKDFKRDPSGCYILIRVNIQDSRIEAAICDKDHNITHIFRGQRSQDLYNAIFSTEKEKNIEWFREKTHMAYLGKELKKAELALNAGSSDYYQE